MNIPLTAQEVLTATGGKLLSGDPQSPLNGVSTDSRTLPNKSLFVALSGDRFDGHDFLSRALCAGAGGLLIEGGHQAAQHTQIQALLATPATPATPANKGEPPHQPTVVVAVPDTLYALGELARFHRNRFDIPVVGITGSCGKTTTRQLVAAALETTFAPVLATIGNFNNRIGLPLTLFGLSGEHGAAVLEMGMNEPGEIDRLTRIACPRVGTITNIGEAHTEKLGGIEGVAKAKGELFHGLEPNAVVVLNLDDPRVMAQHHQSGHRGRQITFGQSPKAMVRLLPHTFSGGTQAQGVCGTIEVDGKPHRMQLALVGHHNLANGACALACALALGVPAEAAIAAMARVTALGRRLAIKRPQTQAGPTIIDDSYNANGASMVAALDVLKGMQPHGPGGKRVAVLGDMLELGSQAEAIHRQVGRHAANAGVDLLVTVGPWSSKSMAHEARLAGMEGRVVCFDSSAEAASGLLPLIRPEDVLLIKASRGIGLDVVADALLGTFNGVAAAASPMGANTPTKDKSTSSHTEEKP